MAQEKFPGSVNNLDSLRSLGREFMPQSLAPLLRHTSGLCQPIGEDFRHSETTIRPKVIRTEYPWIIYPTNGFSSMSRVIGLIGAHL